MLARELLGWKICLVLNIFFSSFVEEEIYTLLIKGLIL